MPQGQGNLDHLLLAFGGVLMGTMDWRLAATMFFTALMAYLRDNRIIEKWRKRWTSYGAYSQTLYNSGGSRQGSPSKLQYIMHYLVAKGYATEMMVGIDKGNSNTSRPLKRASEQVMISDYYEDIYLAADHHISIKVCGYDLWIHSATNLSNGGLTVHYSYPDAFDAFLFECARFYHESHITQCSMFTPAQHNGWRRHDMPYQRNLEHIFWPAEQMQKLKQIADAHSLGFPKYRFSGKKSVLLLSGPPGVGKTCVAMAYATQVNNSCYILPTFTDQMKKIKSGGSEESKMTSYCDTLRELIAGIPTPAVLLWDEFDLVHTTERNSHQDLTVLIRQLLNGDLLRNITIIMTTNHREKLCPVMMRRVDAEFEVDFSTPETRKAANLASDLPDDEAPKIAPDAKISMGTYMRMIERGMVAINDPADISPLPTGDGVADEPDKSEPMMLRWPNKVDAALVK